MSSSESEQSDDSPEKTGVIGHCVTNEGQSVYIVDKWLDILDPVHHDASKFGQHLKDMNEESEKLLSSAGVSRVQRALSDSQKDIQDMRTTIFRKLKKVNRDINSESKYFHHDIYGIRKNCPDESESFRALHDLPVDTYGKVIDVDTYDEEVQGLLTSYNAITNPNLEAKINPPIDSTPQYNFSSLNKIISDMAPKSGTSAFTR